MHATTTAPSTACLICDRANSPGSILCGGCAAPMALVHATEAAQRPPRLVTILGDSNVGKTVYLGFLLDMLTQRAHGFEAIPRGSQSIELSQLVISHLAWRMFPPKTAMEADTWKWSYFEVCKHGRKDKWVDLITPDLAGEAIAAEVASPATFAIIQKLLDRTSGIMLLVDAAAAANGSAQPDFFALKMLSYVDALGAARKSKKIDTPVAIVLTKADHVSECFEQPRKFAEANLNRLWNLCESRLSHYEFFGTSVVGSLGYAVDPKGESAIPVPLHTSLRGVLEPFEWIVNQL